MDQVSSAARLLSRGGGRRASNAATDATIAERQIGGRPGSRLLAARYSFRSHPRRWGVCHHRALRFAV